MDALCNSGDRIRVIENIERGSLFKLNKDELLLRVTGFEFFMKLYVCFTHRHIKLRRLYL